LGWQLLRLIFALVILSGLVGVPAKPAQAAAGVDGSLTISAANTVVNRYVTATYVLNGNLVHVTDINALDDGGAGHYANEDLSPGDMILIYQAQGATFSDTSDSATWGAFNYNSAGVYELALVTSISGDDITVDTSNSAGYGCTGFSNTYNTTDGRVQVVRVPQYTSLTVDPGASITASDWNGFYGGLVVLMVEDTLTVNGSIDVTGKGFRGGAAHNAAVNYGVTTYRTNDENLGALKGESILGSTWDIGLTGSGRYGRGAPANGGGGGNGVNSAGGGGANGDSSGIWNGSGFVSASDPYAAAWDLDDGVNNSGAVPAYFQNGDGGGRGGYTWSEFNADATLQGPGNAAWGGDNRRQVGGLGGRPLANDPNSRVFFGGGGGAGEMNNNHPGSGGDGGGIIIIDAGTLAGSGQIRSNGIDGQTITVEVAKDGPGGGGAGGSIVIKATDVSGVTVSALGGLGGGQTGVSLEAEGAGGGGGGGFVVVAAQTGSLVTTVMGGQSGTVASAALLEMPPNGGSTGYSGASSTSAFSFAGCSTPTAVTLASFTASASIPGHNSVDWVTTTEVSQLGFNVLRSEVVDGERLQLNSEMIVAEGGLEEAVYHFTDRTVTPGKVYYYWLVSIDLFGEELIGPSVVVAQYGVFMPLVR
jgi:hypothetical protein